MKIVVYGAGAVGTWLGVHLSRAGADVTFIARGATFDWLSQSPMELRGPDGTLRIDAHVAHTIPDDADLVIFATKTLGPVDLPELPATTTILTTQNSVEMPHLAVEKYGSEHVIPGVVRSFLTRLAPGITCHDGNIQTLTFGSLHPATRDLAAQLAEILSKTPITPAIRDDILADVWAKALFVTTFGALGALMNQPIGVLRTTYRDSLRALITEAAHVAQANQVALPATIVADTMAFIDIQDPASTSSMQRDIVAGNPNELDAQVGAICRMAGRAGMAAPLHRLVVEAIEAHPVAH